LDGEDEPDPRRKSRPNGPGSSPRLDGDAALAASRPAAAKVIPKVRFVAGRIPDLLAGLFRPERQAFREPPAQPTDPFGGTVSIDIVQHTSRTSTRPKDISSSVKRPRRARVRPEAVAPVSARKADAASPSPVDSVSGETGPEGPVFHRFHQPCSSSNRRSSAISIFSAVS
jgi:hypothetical protein